MHYLGFFLIVTNVHLTILTHWLPEVFAKNAVLGHFGAIQAGYKPNQPQSDHKVIWKMAACLSRAFLFTSISFYDIFALACAEINILNFSTRKWPTALGFSVFYCYFCLLPPFLIFLMQWLIYYWTCFQCQKFWESVIETGVAECSPRQFSSGFFIQTSDNFRPYFGLFWANYSNLGIIRKSISSYRSWL